MGQRITESRSKIPPSESVVSNALPNNSRPFRIDRNLENDAERLILVEHDVRRTEGHKRLWRVREKLRNNTQTTEKINVFPAIGPLEFVAINILGPLTIIKDEKTLLLIITDRLYKMKRSTPMRKLPATKVAEQLVEKWIIPHGPRITFYPISDLS